ncbi:MAG: hypothetical protein LBI87_02225 [Candidatus Accumulibacter sp.]|jgi:hypothetical protein|nr:hypothetical protein [Accumulibacter sp.]
MLNFFSTKRPDHPLGEAREFKRVLAKLPQDAFKAVDEVYNWFESLKHADDFRIDRLYEVVDGLDCAAQPHLRRLTRHYLRTPRLSKNEERRLWAVCFNYWGEVSWLYARCAERLEKNPKEKGADAFRRVLPVAATRLMAARSNQLKWIDFRYGVVGEDLWRGLGAPYLAAEAEGYAQRAVQIYPGAPGTTCVALQYLQALVRASSSMDALLPLEIELADRLIVHFLPAFVFGAECLPGNAYWVDAANAQPPKRMVNPPVKPAPGVRFFQPGAVSQALAELIHAVERGTVPAELNLGTGYPVPMLLKVLQHLAQYWSPVPPKREHVRHAVKTRMSVLEGFNRSLAAFAGNVARLGVERSAESWIVENVSLGGFCAGAEVAGDWLAIGSLLCLQPEGGENWVLGVVRRRGVNADSHHASIGIQTLSRNAQSVELRPRASGLSADAIPGIWLRGDGDDEQARLVLPPGSFDVRQILEFVHEERRYLLTPMEIEESGGDFEIGDYRAQVIA